MQKVIHFTGPAIEPGPQRDRTTLPALRTHARTEPATRLQLTIHDEISWRLHLDPLSVLYSLSCAALLLEEHRAAEGGGKDAAGSTVYESWLGAAARVVRLLDGASRALER